jgi:hypothetical protein
MILTANASLLIHTKLSGHENRVPVSIGTYQARQNDPFGCGSDDMSADWDVPPDRRLCVRLSTRGRSRTVNSLTIWHGGRSPGRDRPRRRSSQRRGHRPAAGPCSRGGAASRQIASPGGRPGPGAASARWLGGAAASRGCARFDRRHRLVTHLCALRRRDLCVYLRLTGFSRLRMSTAASPGERRRAARRIRFRSSPGPEAGEQE